MPRDPIATPILDRNFLDASRIFTACSDTGEYLERRDVAIASCGLPIEQLNWGFLKPTRDDASVAAEAVRAYFTGRKLPFKLLYPGAERARVRALEASGWRRGGEPTPGMTLAIPDAVPAAPDGLEVQEARTPDALVAFRETAFRGFGYPVKAAHVFLNERMLGLPGVRFYVGFAEGAAVATSMLVATGEVAGIYWVATPEDRRGRGYGAALTWAAVAGGRELGCRIASLHASRLGRPVYARMGFAHVLDHESLHPPEP